jgi:hypothetical protein
MPYNSAQEHTVVLPNNLHFNDVEKITRVAAEEHIIAEE